MSKTTPKLECFTFEHLAILALAVNPITYHALRRVLREHLEIANEVQRINQLVKDGYLQEIGYDSLTATSEGKAILKKYREQNQLVKELMTLSALSAASDVSVQTILRHTTELLPILDE